MSAELIDVGATLDLRGLRCPLPVLRTRKRLAGLPSGAELIVETTDALAVIDIPAFCRAEGHELIDSAPTGDGHRFRLRKAP